MSLSKEQKKDLDKIGQELRKLERLSVENKLDLDVFMTSYSDEGYDIYATEKVSMEEQASKRKKVFEKAGKQKTEKVAKAR
ncbi:MAG TPA: hypothetical protein PLI08_01545 [Bacteroidia bacterium]|jgi:hypothetical protein|nr:hypothetical protein [Bacteroidia bacterium]MBP7728427.1 hypothetical protein [Bacteroidia bacterium]MBP7772628.1 hypothetical protein [Bacteroidia bacterium]HPD52603.1 hypothetical protein [Bacteroidia bacterium]HRI41746.1 hypothetical protein [Bacteroidia bacterium]